MRKLNVFVGLLMLMTTCLPANVPSSIPAAANVFALSYNEWTKAYNDKVPGSYSVTEERAWKLVKEQFKVLDKALEFEREQ